MTHNTNGFIAVSPPLPKYHMSRGAAIAIIWLSACAAIVTAQASDATQPAAAETQWSLRNWTRAEAWRFFEPSPGGGDNEYVYVANRLQAGVRRTAARYDITAAIQYVQFGGLPRGAVGPGPLGLGAVYFSHAGRPDSRQIYLSKDRSTRHLTEVVGECRPLGRP